MKASIERSADSSKLHPRRIVLLTWFAAIHTIRVLIGVSQIFVALSPGGQSLFFISGGGDFLIGLLAPFIAFGAARRVGLHIWTSILIWNIVGLLDIIVGNLIGILAPATHKIPIAIFTIPVVLGVLHIISIFLILQPTVIYHYLRYKIQRESQGT